MAGTAEATIQKESYSSLVESLISTQDKMSAQAMIREARAKYPSHPDFQEVEEALFIMIRRDEEARQLRKATMAKFFSDDSRFGSVYHLAYHLSRALS